MAEHVVTIEPKQVDGDRRFVVTCTCKQLLCVTGRALAAVNVAYAHYLEPSC